MKKALLLLLLFIGLSKTQHAQLSAGPFTVGTSADNAVSTYTWGTYTSGGWIASIYSIPMGATTNGLRLTNFGFNIPAAANIVGVQAIITFSVPQGMGKDSVVKLVKNNTEVGNNAGGVHTYTGVTTYTYGANNNLWGSTLTPADVNSANFGVSVRLKNASPTNSLYVTIERTAFQATKMIVYYESTVGIIESQTAYANSYFYDRTFYLSSNVFEDTKFEVYDLSGKKIFDTIVEKDQKQVDLNSLKSGVYFCKMMLGKKEVVQKILVD